MLVHEANQPPTNFNDSGDTTPVADWREFVRLRGLKAGKTPVGNEEALKARKLLAEVDERELRIAVKKGEYVLIYQVKSEWIGLVAQATSILRAKFENELPPILSGLDATGIQRECRKASVTTASATPPPKSNASASPSTPDGRCSSAHCPSHP